jgi:eukaryotic translation initiation factor 2C
MHEEREVLPCKASILRECLSQVSSAYMLSEFFVSLVYRINVKLGGINTIPDPQSVAVLTDPRNPTIVMGQHDVDLPFVLLADDS